MKYLALFRDFVTETTGTVRYYDVSPRYYEELVKRHDGKISGSNGNYVAFDKAVTRTYLIFYVRELKEVARIDVRQKIMKISGLKKISPKFIKSFKSNMPKQVYIKVENKKWVLENDNLIEETIRKSGY